MKDKSILSVILFFVICMCIGCSNAYEDATSEVTDNDNNQETT